MNEPVIDLTGKLIIKVALGDDIRRILITNEDITYDELVLMMQRVYRGKLNSTDDIVIKYKDEDGDLITIFDSSDLTFAIQCSRILKITLFVNSKPEPLQSNEVKMIKSELKHIRDRCNALLDRLDDRVTPDINSTTVDSTSNKGTPSQSVDSPRRPSPSPRIAPPTSAAGSKEFDPLSVQRSADDQQNKVLSSFGIGNEGGGERPGTPDSVSSVGSSSGPRQPQQAAGGVPSQPGTPGPQPGVYAQGSQKPAAWQPQPQQQQQPQNPAAPAPNQPPQGQPQGQPSQYQGQMPPGTQGYAPVLARSMEWNRQYPGQNVMAGHDKPSYSRSYQTALMQSVLYTGHDSAARSSPVPKANTSTSSSYPAGPRPQASYAGSQPTSQPGYQAASNPQYAGYGQGGQPGHPAQPGQGQGQPGHPQMYGQQQQPQQQPQQTPYQSQGQQVPGGPAQSMPMQAPGQQPQQPGQQQQQPQGQPGYAYPGQQQQSATSPGQLPQGPAGSNPYARQGPGYGAGYPRPSAGYPQGYQ